MRNDIMCAILDCGYADLDLLDDSDADFYEIVERRLDEGLPCTLMDITKDVIMNGIYGMDKAVKETKEYLEDLEKEGDIDNDEKEKLNAIREYKLDPVMDFTFYLNYLDTHLYCDPDKREIYDTYFEDEMEKLKRYTGFTIE